MWLTTNIDKDDEYFTTECPRGKGCMVASTRCLGCIHMAKQISMVTVDCSYGENNDEE